MTPLVLVPPLRPLVLLDAEVLAREHDERLLRGGGDLGLVLVEEGSSTCTAVGSRLRERLDGTDAETRPSAPA